MVRAAIADKIFHALSDSTRRNVLERLSQGPATVSELAQPFNMTLPSVVQHLAVLEKSRLVKSRKKGRVRTFEIAPQRLRIAEDWLCQQRQAWESRLERLDEYLKKLHEKERNS